MHVINKKNLESRINELYYSARMFYDWAVMYKNLHKEFIPDYLTNDLMKYLVINSNIYLFYSINSIGSLVSFRQSDFTKKEISLFEHLELINSDHEQAKKDLGNIRVKYDNSKINVLRNKIIAHKDLMTCGDPAGHFLNVINETFFNITIELLDDIQNYMGINFEDRTYNNYVKEFYDNSHKKMLNIIKDQLLQYS